MSVLIGALYGLFTLAGGILVRVLAAVALLGLVLIIALPGVFAWYWLSLMYDSAVGIRSIGDLRWRRDSYYTPGHLWLRPIGAQTVRVGVDDIGQRVLHGITSISLAEAGTRIGVGQPIADIRCDRANVMLRSPVAGTIAAANRRLGRAPTLLNRDSYRRAWLVEIEPSDGGFDRWLSGGRARAWLANEGQRLTGCFERALGVAAADGGELIRTPPTALSDEQWRDLRVAFLETPAFIDATPNQN
jgi:glycine cleavage system H protein